MPNHLIHNSHNHHQLTRPRSVSFFRAPKNGHKDTQIVNVTVNIDQKENCLTECFKALIGCFKKSG